MKIPRKFEINCLIHNEKSWKTNWEQDHPDWQTKDYNPLPLQFLWKKCMVFRSPESLRWPIVIGFVRRRASSVNDISIFTFFLNAIWPNNTTFFLIWSIFRIREIIELVKFITITPLEPHGRGKKYILSKIFNNLLPFSNT